MVYFYELGNGNLIIDKKAIIKLQKTEWAKEQGGICGVLEYTEPRAVFFAFEGTAFFENAR